MHPPRLVGQLHVGPITPLGVEPRYVKIALVPPVHRVPRTGRSDLERIRIFRTVLSIARAHENFRARNILVFDEQLKKLCGSAVRLDLAAPVNGLVAATADSHSVKSLRVRRAAEIRQRYRAADALVHERARNIGPSACRQRIPVL